MCKLDSCQIMKLTFSEKECKLNNHVYNYIASILLLLYCIVINYLCRYWLLCSALIWIFPSQIGSVQFGWLKYVKLVGSRCTWTWITSHHLLSETICQRDSCCVCHLSRHRLININYCRAVPCVWLMLEISTTNLFVSNIFVFVFTLTFDFLASFRVFDFFIIFLVF